MVGSKMSGAVTQMHIFPASASQQGINGPEFHDLGVGEFTSGEWFSETQTFPQRPDLGSCTEKTTIRGGFMSYQIGSGSSGLTNTSPSSMCNALSTFNVRPASLFVRRTAARTAVQVVRPEDAAQSREPLPSAFGPPLTIMHTRPATKARTMEKGGIYSLNSRRQEGQAPPL
jgi:hypothetical protein